jgi:hypothetical protein
MLFRSASESCIPYRRDRCFFAPLRKAILYSGNLLRLRCSFPNSFKSQCWQILLSYGTLLYRPVSTGNLWAEILSLISTAWRVLTLQFQKRLRVVLWSVKTHLRICLYLTVHNSTIHVFVPSRVRAAKSLEIQFPFETLPKMRSKEI